MSKWFKNESSVEELRKQYKKLLKKFHPDNEGGNAEFTQEINAEYDRIFADLSKENKSDDKSSTCDDEAENEAFKAILNQIININADVEIIGSWVWIHGGYEYRELLKSIGFKFACELWQIWRYQNRIRTDYR